MSLVSRFLIAVAFVCLGVPSTPLVADTVYLKNGAWIDGRVRAHGEKVVTIEIGRIGKLEIPITDIHKIEKNGRTGDHYEVPSGDRKLDITHVTGNDRNKKEKVYRQVDNKKKEGREPEGEGGENAEEGVKWESSFEEADLDPKLKERIEALVKDLDRQKSRYRVRAERHLKAIGPPCVPFILPLASSERGLTRIAVFRLFHDFGDDRVVDRCIEGLLDSSEYVRSYAKKALKRITQQSFGYIPSAAPRRRELAQKKWVKWWAGEKKELAAIKKLRNP